MTVRVIVGQAIAKPNELFDAERRAQAVLDLGLLERRIAVGIEQALARGQARTEAVHIDGAAFQYPIARRDRQASRLRQRIADILIAVKIEPVAPAIKAEIAGDPAIAFTDNDAACVA